MLLSGHIQLRKTMVRFIFISSCHPDLALMFGEPGLSLITGPVLHVHQKGYFNSTSAKLNKSNEQLFRCMLVRHKSFNAPFALLSLPWREMRTRLNKAITLLPERHITYSKIMETFGGFQMCNSESRWIPNVPTNSNPQSRHVPGVLNLSFVGEEREGGHIWSLH